MSKSQTFSALLKHLMIVIMLISISTQSCVVQNCNTCYNGSYDQCSSCATGYRQALVSCCSNSLVDCARCLINDSQICLICYAGYFKQNNTCLICAPPLKFCYTCSNTTTCTSCQSTDYAINSTSSKCQLCSEFMKNCVRCTNQNECQGCINDSYAVNMTSLKCQKCSQLLINCTNCINQYFCINCTTDPKIVLFAGQCTLCINVMPKCLTCIDINYCTKCEKFYSLKYQAGTALCYPCSVLIAGCSNCQSSDNCTNCSFGQVIMGGCSIVAGCKVVIQAQPIPICTACQAPQFYPIPINGTCICTVGHLAGRYCTKIIGCTSINRTRTADYCTSCNYALRFSNINNTCICKQYYELKGQKCQEICGDGKLFILPCDDGNFINGDGCSSSCQVEVGFSCNSTNNGKSKCIYLMKVNMYLDCVYHLKENTANIVFKIKPPIQTFKKSKLTNLIRFDTSLNFTILSYEIADDLLYVKIQYEQDIQNGNAIAIIGYDQEFFATPNSTIPFTFTGCNGQSLLYDPNYSNINEKIITIAVKIICGLAWLSWLVGSYPNKMIGVETLHTIQLIFIMQSFALRYKPVIYYFKELNNVLNGYQKLFVFSYAITFNKKYEFMNFSSDLFYNTSLFAIVSLPFIIVYIYLAIRQKIETSKANSYSNLIQLKESKSVRRWIKYQQLLYRRCIFPLIMALFLNFILSIMIQSNANIQKQSTSQLLSTLLSLYMTLSIFIIFSKEMFVHQSADTVQSHKIGYTQKYLIIIFLVAITIHIFLCRIVDYQPVYFVAGAQILYSATVLLFRPYNSLFHTFCLLINQIGIIINIIWIVSQKFFRLNRQIEEMFGLALVGWMFVILISSFLRVLYQIKTKKTDKKLKIQKNSKKKVRYDYQNQLIKNSNKHNYTQFNQYCLNSELLKKKVITADKRINNKVIRQNCRQDNRKPQFKRIVDVKTIFDGFNERQAL